MVISEFKKEKKKKAIFVHGLKEMVMYVDFKLLQEIKIKL